VFLIILILILIVLIVLSFHTVLYIFCTRIPVSASDPMCSIISVHFICLLIDFRIVSYRIVSYRIVSYRIVSYRID